jgi:D-threo-aldose 1-dehydrogenase
LELMRRRLGRTGLELTALGCGGTALGNLFAVVSEGDAIATAQKAFEFGIRYFDTAPIYGHGLSEHRLGTVLRQFGVGPICVSTKVGFRLLPARGADPSAGLFQNVPPFVARMDYSYDGAMRSFEDSLQRLGRDRVDILFLHDLDRTKLGENYAKYFREAMAGAYKALSELREQKVVGGIGCGLNEWRACEDFAHAGDFDCFLLAGRYTLLDQSSLDSFLPLCEKRNIGVVLGGPYNSGILGTGGVPGAVFDYKAATDEVLERVRNIEGVCARHGVKLKSAALQFPLHHPAIASVIPGMRHPSEVRENVELLKDDIPVDFWGELRTKSLIRADAPTPRG